MLQRARLFLLPLMMCCSVVSAQPAEPAQAVEDVEDAKTPSNILELLPEDEEDWPQDFWLTVDGGDGEELYMGWSVRRVKETVVVKLRTGDKAMQMRSQVTYSAKGDLVSYASHRQREGGSSHTVNGKVVGDHLEVTSIRTYPDGFRAGPQTDTQTYPMKQIDRAVLLEMAPVIVGYHARQGSLGYTGPLMVLMNGTGTTMDLKVVDIGTESVEIDGKPRKAHVLQVTLSEQDDGDAPTHEPFRMSAVFLENGEFVSLKLEHDAFPFQARRTTIDQVAERFGKDKAELVGE